MTTYAIIWVLPLMFFTFTSSKTGQVGTSFAFLQTGLNRQGTGKRMLTFFPRPSLFAVTSPTVTLAIP